MPEIEAGPTYRVKGQGSGITPRTIDIEVVSLTDSAVFYRIVGPNRIDQTTPDRFKEIINT